MKTSTFLIVAGLIGGAALVQGAVTQRWAMFSPDPARTNRLHALEVHFSDWQPTEVPTEMPVNERSTATARRYQSAAGPQSAVITIISGIPGSVSTHTPDICYVGAGYRCIRGPRKEAVELPGGASAAFYVADFEKKKASRVDRVRVRWSWSTDGPWVAPDNPRWQFARRLNSPELFKLYIATPLPDTDEEGRAPEDDAVTQAFVAAAWVQFAAGFN